MGDTQNGQDEQTEWEGADIDTSTLVGDGSRTVRDEVPAAGDGAGAAGGDDDGDGDGSTDIPADGSADAAGVEVNDG